MCGKSRTSFPRSLTVWRSYTPKVRQTPSFLSNSGQISTPRCLKTIMLSMESLQRKFGKTEHPVCLVLVSWETTQHVKIWKLHIFTINTLVLITKLASIMPRPSWEKLWFWNYFHIYFSLDTRAMRTWPSRCRPRFAALGSRWWRRWRQSIQGLREEDTFTRSIEVQCVNTWSTLSGS